MLTYPEIDPVAFRIGPLSVYWYGLMYLIGIGAAWLLMRHRAKRADNPLQPAQIDDLIFWVVVGMLAGGRLGYLLFYQPAALAADPLLLVRVWEGGMAFHGGLLGVIVAAWLYARYHRLSIFDLTDLGAPTAAIGLGAGRIGNFINAELWGRVTDMPWGMVFPGAGPDPRHPSQLYQFALEGVVLFLILWWFSAKPRPRMAVSGLFLALYGLFRFGVEFFREPDAHLGFIAFEWLTMGQILSLPMLLLGILLLALAYRRPQGSGG